MTETKKKRNLFEALQKSSALKAIEGYVGGKLSVWLESSGVLDWLVEKGYSPARLPWLQEILEYAASLGKDAVSDMPPGHVKRIAGILAMEGHQILQRVKRKTDNVDAGREVLRDRKKDAAGQDSVRTVQVQGIGAVAAVLAKVNTLTSSGKSGPPDILSIRILNHILDGLHGADKITVCTILSGWKRRELSNLQYYCNNGADLARILGIELTHAEKPEVTTEDHVSQLTELMAAVTSLKAEEQTQMIDLFKLLTTDADWQRAVALLSPMTKAKLESFLTWDPVVQHKMLGIDEQQTDTTATADEAVEKVKSMWAQIQEQLTSWASAFNDHLEKVRVANAARVSELDKQCEQAWALVASTGGDQ